MSSDYSSQILHAGVLGRRYRELKEQGDTIIAVEKDDNRRRALEAKFRFQLEGFNLCALMTILDTTAREQYEGFKAGRRK